MKDWAMWASVAACVAAACLVCCSGCTYKSPHVTIHVHATNGVHLVEIHDNIVESAGANVNPKVSYK